LLASYSPSAISWIVSLETFFMFFGAPFVGNLYDNFGPRRLLVSGTFLHVFGLMVSYEAGSMLPFIEFNK
jgi:MFS family permease